MLDFFLNYLYYGIVGGMVITAFGVAFAALMVFVSWLTGDA